MYEGSCTAVTSVHIKNANRSSRSYMYYGFPGAKLFQVLGERGLRKGKD